MNGSNNGADQPGADQPGVRRIVYPPIWLAIGVIAIFVVDEFWPGLRFAGTLFQFIGGAVLLLGLTLLVLANNRFGRAGTGVIPFKGVSALVTSGVYRFTRNPMYLGMTLVLLGCALTVGAATALVIPIVFAVIIQRRFILAEEAMLSRIFGDDYSNYCSRVRRWL